MKKQYINPNTIIVELEMQHLMAGSVLNQTTGEATEWGAKEHNFDFFAAPEVEEENPNKNKSNQEEEWDEFEEEE